MASLHIIYDPDDKVFMPHRDDRHGCRLVSLDISDGLEGRDIYEVARKLAELLLEQLV